MTHLMIVTKHHDPILDQESGQLLVPAQVLPEPVTEEHRGPHHLVRARPPVAGEQLVTSRVVSYGDQQRRQLLQNINVHLYI